MQEDYYLLQSYIYTLALHLYLRLRKPGYRYENDFGGVFYIFLRGIAATFGPEYGIYRDRPTPQLIHALGNALIPAYS
jgi:exodeoxyribonuclease V beta subunit